MPPTHPSDPFAPPPRSLTPVVLIVAALVVVIGVIAAFLLLRGTAATPGAHPTASPPTPALHPVRVAVEDLRVDPADGEPKAVVALYEDFLCPGCGHFEQTFGETIGALIDSGAIAADYYPVAILDSGERTYSSRAGAAAYCVADESVAAFRRFHALLFNPQTQPDETSAELPDDAQLAQWAREVGATGAAVDCINAGTYRSAVKEAASAAGLRGTPTVRINGEDYAPRTPEALRDKITEIVGA
ncbi:MAG TPA: DsbA family protein [Mycolicibacillus parakoreensis]|nr:DsbA family protein [Mycolicibacillus parakoreensis]